MTVEDSNDDSEEGLQSQDDDVDSQLNGNSNQFSPLGPGTEIEEPNRINLVLADDGNTSR